MTTYADIQHLTSMYRFFKGSKNNLTFVKLLVNQVDKQYLYDITIYYIQYYIQDYINVKEDELLIYANDSDIYSCIGYLIDQYSDIHQLKKFEQSEENILTYDGTMQTDPRDLVQIKLAQLRA